MDIFILFFSETYSLFLEMAPYLLFGFFMAGVLKVLIPQATILRHLSGNSFKAVINAALIGVPLPVCSCGVIPLTAHLHKSGCSKGATLSFLVSTPTTGVDSILATYALLGWTITLMRIGASFFIGILSGIIANIFTPSPPHLKTIVSATVADEDQTKSIKDKVLAMMEYSFISLIDDIGKWLVIGILTGGAISALIPKDFVATYLGNPWVSYPLMIAIGLPMYVCSTGSIPIAAALVMKGLSPGAALVFLITGPATNTATMSFVWGKLGKSTFFIYIASIIIGAVLWGGMLDLSGSNWLVNHSHDHGSSLLFDFIKSLSALFLFILLAMSFWRTKAVPILSHLKSSGGPMPITIKVPDMTCQHCQKKIEQILTNFSEIKSFKVDLKRKSIHISGKPNLEELLVAIKAAGYSPET